MATSFPEWLEPMAATLTQERFTAPGWVFERKLDGIRLLAFKQGKDVRLLSRNRLPQNAAYPAFVKAMEALHEHDLILDGEATGVWGKPDRVAYHVFDILWLEGHDLTALTLDARRERLESLRLQPPLELVERLDDPEPWERACREGWEGVIAKRRDAPYEHRRSKYWLKMKCEATQELVVGGFTEPQGGRVGLGALLVGYFEGGEFVFAGKVGTGFDTRLLLHLRARLNEIEVAKPPFTRAVDLPRQGAHWVRSEIVVQVGFIEWTAHGKLRHPRLLGIREDKAAHEVVREYA
jgi:bifunctional non-homologous end joining protein LigD